MNLLLIGLAIALGYGYVLALFHRIGRGRRRHARIWSRPRPSRLLAHSAREAPRSRRRSARMRAA